VGRQTNVPDGYPQLSLGAQRSHPQLHTATAEKNARKLQLVLPSPFFDLIKPYFLFCWEWTWLAGSPQKIPPLVKKIPFEKKQLAFAIPFAAGGQNKGQPNKVQY
jgi:hypothetical protein